MSKSSNNEAVNNLQVMDLAVMFVDRILLCMTKLISYALQRRTDQLRFQTISLAGENTTTQMRTQIFHHCAKPQCQWYPGATTINVKTKVFTNGIRARSNNRHHCTVGPGTTPDSIHHCCTDALALKISRNLKTHGPKHYLER